MFMQNEWFDSLDEETRLKAQKMIEQMQELGAKDAESWVRSEIAENIPQMVSFLILKQLWKEIDSFEENVSNWTKSCIDEAEKRPQSHFAELGLALKRMLSLGVSLEDIGNVAKFVAFESIFRTMYVIGYGYVSDNLPGWELIETDSEGKSTGRSIQCLYESLLAR